MRSFQESAAHLESVAHEAESLSEAEQAVWRDPELLTRIEAVLDDPSLAVPLDRLD